MAGFVVIVSGYLRMTMSIRIAGIGTGLAILATPLAAQDCLFADTSTAAPSQCRGDVYGLAAQPAISRAVIGLGFYSAQLQFRGCATGRFATSFNRGQGVYTISYPLSSGYSLEKYLGPLAHELGHAAQVRESGSMAAFLQQMPNSARRELGADFLAGLIFRRVMNHLDQQDFEESLDLLGNYETGDQATHGQPEARTSAFRMGFSYQNATANPMTAHRDFQRNRFGIIMNALLR